MAHKHVITACGSGVATSQTIASRINRMFKEDHFDADCEAVKISGVDRYFSTADAYVCITNDRKNKTFPLPVFNGMPFLTGIGVEAEYAALCEALGFKK